MYSRQSDHRGISIPRNYSGNAFSEMAENNDLIESESGDGSIKEASTIEAEAGESKTKNFLPINIGSEELIIIGIALLLFQSGNDDGIIPLLLAILLLG